MMIIVSGVFHFIGKKTETINNYYKDSVIERYHDTLKYFKKEIIKNKYEYKTDSVILPFMPDSVLSIDIMQRTRRILNYGFTETDKHGTIKSRTLPDGINSSERPATDSKRDD